MVLAPGTPPSNFLWIQTVQPIRVVINGGTDSIPIDRILIITGDITTIEIFNDVVASVKDVQIDVTFGTGTYL